MLLHLVDRHEILAIESAPGNMIAVIVNFCCERRDELRLNIGFIKRRVVGFDDFIVDCQCDIAVFIPVAAGIHQR